MSLFSDILSGVSTVGQIAQGISSLLGDPYEDNSNAVVIEGGFNLGAVHFAQVTDNGQPKLNVYNRSLDRWVQVATPTWTLSLSPSTTSAIDLFALTNASNMPVETTVSSAPQYGTTVGGEVGGGPQGSLFNLSIKNLKVGKNISISGFRVSCTTTQLIIVPGMFMASYTILRNLDLSTLAGNGVRLIAPMMPAFSSEGGDVSADDGNIYNVNFEDYGINTSISELDGAISLESTNIGSTLSSAQDSKELLFGRDMSAFERDYMKDKGLWLN